MQYFLSVSLKPHSTVHTVTYTTLAGVYHKNLKRDTFFCVGVLSTRMWMASTAVGLLLLIAKGHHKAEKAWVPLMLLSWGYVIQSYTVVRGGMTRLTFTQGSTLMIYSN